MNDLRPIFDMLCALDGAHLQGGCDHCDAYQEPVRHHSGGVLLRTVHDPWCIDAADPTA